LNLFVRAGQTKKRARVPHREAPFRDEELDFFGQLQQTDDVGDRRSVLACPAANFLLRKPQIAAQSLKGVRCFNRVQVLALYIFDQCELQHGAICNVLDYDGHFLKLRDPGSPPSALACYYLVTIASTTNDQGLNDPVCPDRGGQLFEPVRIEVRARLHRIGLD
jgi:hypothetical protein